MIDNNLSNLVCSFIETKEYRRFEEFAQACDEFRYIGLCYGSPGVGKTVAAKYYAQWHAIQNSHQLAVVTEDAEAQINQCKAVFYTARQTSTPKVISQQLYGRLKNYGSALLRVQGKTDWVELLLGAERRCPLVIVDEADSLRQQSLEQLRNLYDEYGFGLVLIGMPGFEKRLTRYPQLFSRVGFAHEFQPLSMDEMEFIFEKQWQQLGLQLNKEQFSDVEAIRTIARITNGNFRLIRRLFDQINRLLKINNLKYINADVVMAARNCLVMA